MGFWDWVVFYLGFVARAFKGMFMLEFSAENEDWVMRRENGFKLFRVNIF